jgi:hypothetical protein
MDADVYATAARALLGRPPSLPFARTAAVFARDVALPPAFPSCAAIQLREPAYSLPSFWRFPALGRPILS